jgi:hypothetical protein
MSISKFPTQELVLGPTTKFDRLKEWIISNGGVIHDGIGIDESNVGNRVLIAKEEIPKDTLIFEIPKDLCIIRNHNLKVNPNFEKFEREIHLVSFLKQEFELGPKSFYYPYLNFLPLIEDFKDHPVYVGYKNPTKLSEWRKICVFSGAASIAMTNLKFVKLYFDKMTKIEISEDELLYYYLLIITRTWGEVGFVPFADLFQSRQTSGMFLEKNEENMRQILTVDRNYKTNDVIWINYGLYDDSLIYTNFGFIDDMDRSESLPRSMRVNLTKEGKQEGVLKEFVSSELNKFKPNTLFFSTSGISKAIFEYLRIINLTEKEYELIMNDELDRMNYMKKIVSIENEFKVYQNLFSLIFSSNFPTKEMVELSKDIFKKEQSSTIEYHLATLTMIQKDIFKNTFSSLVKTWIGAIGVPSEIISTFNNHYLLDQE